MKYKLLIVDDEPLVQVGIKSMLDWASLGIEICGTATNGAMALEMIRNNNPDIVITDIKMPVMTGIELLENYRKASTSSLPLFIMLTSYEEFALARKAISLRAFEYLVKVELTQESLGDVIRRAIKQIEENLGTSDTTDKSNNSTVSSLQSYTDKFMISLLNSLFESKEQLLLQANDLHLSFDYKSYICCYGSFESEASTGITKNLFALYDSALQMVQELTEKFQACHTISLDMSHFALLFCFTSEATSDDIANLSDMLDRVQHSLKNYMSVAFRCGIGTIVYDPVNICESYQHSRLSYRQADINTPIMYISSDSMSPHDTFNFSLFQKALTKAYEEYNSALLKDTISSLSDLLCAHPSHYVQALDAASNILYMSISLLPNGVQIVSDFFDGIPEGYMSLYRKKNTSQIIEWLDFLVEKLCVFFDESNKDYKNKLVKDVKAYIEEHIREKLTLNEVAAQFGISPSYLSQLFSRYSETGFNEYINIRKIEIAKRMLKDENARVYEVADALSFGSEFYLSKVFKKIEGISPTEYANRSHQ